MFKLENALLTSLVPRLTSIVTQSLVPTLALALESLQQPGPTRLARSPPATDVDAATAALVNDRIRALKLWNTGSPTERQQVIAACLACTGMQLQSINAEMLSGSQPSEHQRQTPVPLAPTSTECVLCRLRHADFQTYVQQYYAQTFGEYYANNYASYFRTVVNATVHAKASNQTAVEQAAQQQETDLARVRAIGSSASRKSQLP